MLCFTEAGSTDTLNSLGAGFVMKSSMRCGEIRHLDINSLHLVSWSAFSWLSDDWLCPLMLLFGSFCVSRYHSL